MLSAFRPKGVPLSRWKFLLVLDHKFSCLVFIDVLSLSATERFYPAISVGHCFSHPARFVSNALCLERVTKFVSSTPPYVCRKWGCALAFEEVFFLVLTSQYGDCCIQQLYFLREREKLVCVHHATVSQLYPGVNHLMWVLDIKLRSFGRAANALNHKATSPAHCCTLNILLY